MKRSRGDDIDFERAPKRLETEFRSLNLDPEFQALRDKEQTLDEEEPVNEPSLIIDPKFLQIPSFILQQINEENERRNANESNQLILHPDEAEQGTMVDPDEMHLSD